MRGVPWKAIFTVLIFILSIWFLLPTIRLALLSPEKKEQNPGLVDELQMNGIKLGLDLRGGTHLVLEVDTTDLHMDLDTIPIDIALEVIRSRVDQFGVSEPVIQQVGGKRIIVELPGIQNIENAKTLIQETAVLEFRLMRDVKDVTRFVNSMDNLLATHPEILEKAKQIVVVAKDSMTEDTVSTEDIESAKTDKTDIEKEEKDTIDKESEIEEKPKPITMGDLMKKDSLKALAEQESTVTQVSPEEQESVITGAAIFGEDTTAVPEIPEVGVKPFSSMIELERNSIFVLSSYVDIIERLLDFTEVKEYCRNSIFLWDAHYDSFEGLRVKQLYMLKNQVELTGDHLTKARWHLGQGYSPRNAGRPIINLEFDAEGTRIFRKVTGANIKRRLAIVLNEKVYTAPTINTKISNGKAIIEGIRDISEAKVITIVLRAGTLPIPLIIVEERTVGPSLGEDSIRSGVTAAIIGLIIVMLFMLIYYRFAGIVANIALVLNIIILMAAMALLRATLTLPGIAGIILIIGMAVDANVLIYERIREELRAGRTIRMAIDAGYSRALVTILDANITTLIAALVLLYFGSGPIRGFAVTLSMGLVISMFTAIIVTRMIFDWYLSTTKKETLAI